MSSILIGSTNSNHFRTNDLAHKPRKSPGCAKFHTTVRPGTSDFDDYSVTWWDSKTLRLDVPITLGIPQRELPGRDAPEGVVAEDLRGYAAWQEEREATIETGGIPERRIETAIERSLRTIDSPDVEVVSIRRVGAAAPGTRYGALIHAVLAAIDLRANEASIRAVASLHARILDARSTR